MKLNAQPRIQADPALARDLVRELKEHAQAVNAMAEGRLAATYNAQTAVPTTGSYAQGDVVRNSAPSELGSGGSKYVIYGWMCLASGTPGTFVQMRFLTGN